MDDLVKKHSERPEVATQKIQKTVMIPQAQYSVRDRERGEAFFQLEADMQCSRRAEHGSRWSVSYLSS